MTTEQAHKLSSKHSESHIWTKPITQEVLQGLRKATYGPEDKPLFNVVKEIEQDFYITYTVTGLVKNVGICELLIATSTKLDRNYIVRHHKQLFKTE